MTATILERRAIERPVELRAAAEGSPSPGVLTGYAAVFNSESRDLGGLYEVIDPRAFGEPGELDLGKHVRVIGRTNHDSNLLLGTTDANTLRVVIDDVGVSYEIDLPNTSYARDLAVLAGRGDIRFSSFAFRTTPDGRTWEYDENDRLVSRVVDGILADVAPVADPAYWSSSSELTRSAINLDEVRERLNPKPPAPGPAGERELAYLTRYANHLNTKEQ